MVGRIQDDRENTHGEENIDADKDEFGRLERNLAEKSEKKIDRTGWFAAHQTSGLTKNSREGVNELDYWTNAIDKFAIFVAIFFERFHVLFKEPKNSTWRVTALDLVSKRIIF